MKLNWKVRVKNKGFWLALIPAALLLVQAVGQVFGLTLELDALGEQLLGVVNALVRRAGHSGGGQRPHHPGAFRQRPGHDL